VATPEEFAAFPVAGVGEFDSGSANMPAMLRMVLRSTPVSLAISRWLVPLASNVATVQRGNQAFPVRSGELEILRPVWAGASVKVALHVVRGHPIQAIEFAH
jgi:hypothetical protein